MDKSHYLKYLGYLCTFRPLDMERDAAIGKSMIHAKEALHSDKFIPEDYERKLQFLTNQFNLYLIGVSEKPSIIHFKQWKRGRILDDLLS